MTPLAVLKSNTNPMNDNHEDEDQLEINQLIEAMYAVFDNRADRVPNFDRFKAMCLPEVMITKIVKDSIETMTLESFISPRKELLSNGTFTEFWEWENQHQTIVQSKLAIRISAFEKKGILHGQSYTGKGTKHIQLLQTKNGWKISAINWEEITS